MKEVNRIVVGLVALRLMKDGETQQYEIFESNKMNKLDKTEWKKIDLTRLHQLSFDKRVQDWINQHKNSDDNVLNFPAGVSKKA
jgi:hypothetical protein